NMASNGLEPGIPKLWVHETYWLKTWEEMYSYKINPCNGLDMWPQSDNPITLTTPNYKPPIGRPQKKRRKSATEIYDGLVKKGRLSRTGKTAFAQAPQSSTQPSQSSRFIKSTANRLSPLKNKFVCPRPAATQKKVAPKQTAATKKKVVPNAKDL
ncbi:hypothetical protein Tco_1461941, partial [Tanacetum coccineum]